MNDTKQVPICPTLEMVKAGLAAYYAKGAGKTQEAMRKAYVAILEAAPDSGECEWSYAPDQKFPALWDTACGRSVHERIGTHCYWCGGKVRIKP